MGKTGSAPGVIACAALAVVLVGAAEATGGQADGSRLRSGGPDVTTLIALGSARSTTFRALVDSLERSSVIVYVRFGRCVGRVAACLNYLGERTGDRYARITINRFEGSQETLCCLLAHELQHALELNDVPNPHTRRDVERVFTAIGRQWGEGYETTRAIAVARAVQQELLAK